jgi:ABC-type transport system substrate-binding protein
MLVKRILVIMPIVLLAFLLQSVFWVPGTKTAASDESRLNRLVWYMGATPEDMNPYQSTSATDSTIYLHLGDGLLRYNEMFEIEPHMAHHAAIHHEINFLVPESIEDDALAAAIEELFGDALEGPVEHRDWRIGSNDAWAKVASDATFKPVLEYLGQARQRRVVFPAESRTGEIVSAVVPDFLEQLQEKLGQELHPPALNVKKFVAALSEADKSRVTQLAEVERGKTLEDTLENLFAKTGNAAVTHNPVVEFQIRKGVYWVEGPFFEPVERTWLVTVGEEEAGYITANSAEAAMERVRNMLRLENTSNMKAEQFTETFGEEGGPWWGKGPELSSRDVKLTLELLRDPIFASPRMSSWEDVHDVRTFDDDPQRVQVVYRRLYSPAVSNLTGGYLPFHHWNRTAWTLEAVRKGSGPADVGVDPADYNPGSFLRAKSRSYSRKPSSYGPLVLYPVTGDTEPLWENGRLVRLMRNEFYWDRKPEYDWVDYYIFNPQMGAETAEMVFTTGGIDLYAADPHQVRRYTGYDDRFTVIQRQTTSYTYIGFNTGRAPVNDVKVRKALAMALDMDKLIEFIVWGQGTRISGPGYPVLPWYNHDYRIKHEWRTGPNAGETEELEFVPYSLAEARALLEEAGYDYSSGVPVKDGRPFELTITMHTGNQTRRDIAIFAQQEWQKLGIQVKLEEHEWNVYLSRYIRPRNFTVCVLGWTGGIDFDKRQLWHSDYFPPTGLNFASFKNEEADRIMDDILKVYDFETQVKMSHRMFELVADELPYIFLYSPLTTTVVDPRVVWRREEIVDGQKQLVNRPLRHEDIANARAPFTYWMYELKRLPEIPQWTDSDYRD